MAKTNYLQELMFTLEQSADTSIQLSNKILKLRQKMEKDYKLIPKP